MSTAGHLLNLQLDLCSGRIVHIHFRLCFDETKNQPQWPKFRLFQENAATCPGPTQNDRGQLPSVLYMLQDDPVKQPRPHRRPASAAPLGGITRRLADCCEKPETKTRPEGVVFKSPHRTRSLSTTIRCDSTKAAVRRTLQSPPNIPGEATATCNQQTEIHHDRMPH
jgi:hypothetical protein